MAESRLIALELGYDYISTIHFFLADCRLNDKNSIKNFVFGSTDDFQSVFNTQKIGEPKILFESLALTVEAEQTIKRTFKLWKVYRDNQIRPYHLFLAATQSKKTLLYSILQPTKELFVKLENYYIQTGQINPGNIRKSIWSRFL